MSKPKLDYSNLIHGINGQKKPKKGYSRGEESFYIQKGNGHALDYIRYKGDISVFDATHPHLKEMDNYLSKSRTTSDQDLEP